MAKVRVHEWREYGRREENKGRRGKRTVVGATCSYNFDSLFVPVVEEGVVYVDGEERA